MLKAPIIISQRRIKKWLVNTAILTFVIFFFFLRSFLDGKQKNWQFITSNEIVWYAVRGADYRPLSFDQKNIYASNLDGYTYCLDKDTGKENWRFRTDLYSIYPKATDSKSLVYISDFDGRIYAIDRSTGQERWRFVTPELINADTEPVVSGDFLYFGSRNGVFYALDKSTGKKKWQFKTQGIDTKRLVKGKTIFHFGLFIVDEKNVYINSSADNAIYSLDKMTGQTKWRFDSYQYVHEKPMLGKKTITFRSSDSYFFTLDKETGQVKWRWLAQTGEPQSVFVTNDYLYYVNGNNNLYKYSSNGQTNQALWRYHSDEFIPDIREWLVVSGNRIYLTTVTPDSGGRILALNDQTGEKEWQFRTNTFINYSPQVNDELIYLASGGDLYALEKMSGGQKWRFKGNGRANSVFATKEGIYLVQVESEKNVMVYFIDKETGEEKWRFKGNDVAVETFTEEDGDLYFLDQDEKSIFSLRSSNAIKILEPNDIRKISSSDLAFQNKSQSFIRKILGPAKKLTLEPLIQMTGFTDKKRKIEVIPEGKEVDRYDIYELTVKHEDSYYDNPWEETNVSVEFEKENGTTYNIKAFYYDKNTWKVRFAPPNPGTWSWKLAFESPFMRTTKKGSFVVQNSSNPGFVRIHPTNPYRFVLEDGDLFIPLGLQDCFVDYNHTGNVLDQLGIGFDKAPNKEAETVVLSDLETYLKIYGPRQAGFNLFRFNVDNCSEKLWRDISPYGNYFGINAGIRGDRLAQTLKKNNYRIWMSLFSFDLPLEASIKKSSYRKAFESYLDYIVARYASYIDIWELANEISLDEEWIEFAAEYLRSIDPYNHPVTVNWERPDLPQIEINSIHWYVRESELNSDLIMANRINLAKRWKKPVVFSEHGNVKRNWDETSARRMRIRSWTSFFEEAVLIFWNTSAFWVEEEHKPANIYLGPIERQYSKVLQDFVKGADPDITKEPIKVEDEEIRGYGLRSEKYFLAYLHNGSSHTKLTSSSVELDLNKDGILEWVDPKTGEIVERRKINSGRQSVKTPQFKIDLAMKITFD